MKLLIPDDWINDDWLCIEVQWPNSPLWVALLNGWLSQMARGRTYDEATGSILAAMEIGKEIWRRNATLTPCCDGGATPPEPSPEQKMIYGGAWFGEEDEDMSCGFCYRYNDAGVMEILVCGEWVPVLVGDSPPPIETPEGTDVGDPNTPQPGDDEEVDIDVKCRAAYALARAMWRVHARIIDYVDDVIGVLDIGNSVASDLPEYTLTKYHVSLAAGSLIAASLTADLDIVFATEETYVSDMAAWMKKFLPTRYSLSRVQYEALAAGLLAYSFHEGIEVNLGQLVEGDYWRQIWWALGPGTVNDIMAQSRTLPAEEFECNERTIPEVQPPLPPADSGPWFTGLITKQAGEGVLAITALSSNMRKATVRWMVDAPGDQFTDIQFLLAMIAPSNLTGLTVKLTGEYPLADWHSLPYSRWDNPHIPDLQGVTNLDDTLGEHTSAGTTWALTFDAGKPEAYKAGATNTARFLPADTRELGATCEFSIEIIAFTLA